jgi:non-lysosomal glucosylceramidase
VHISKKDQPPVATVLYPGKPTKNTRLASDWDWKVKGDKSTYHGLFPRAWTVYEEPEPTIRLVCRQVSPVIPHNYKESSYPCGVFVWTIENVGDTEADVSIMFSFQNGMGGTSDNNAGHSNSPFDRRVDGNEIKGITMKHKIPQQTMVDGKSTTFDDPLSFAIGVLCTDGSNPIVSQCSKFQSGSSSPSLAKLWSQFKANGTITDVEDWRSVSEKNKTIAGAMAAKVTVPPGSKKEIVFGIAWDSPIARFSSGASYYRRYTSFFGHRGNTVQDILCNALCTYKEWETMIDQWQGPILNDPGLPDFYKHALFNELYYIVDGGTIWTTRSKTTL